MKRFLIIVFLLISFVQYASATISKTFYSDGTIQDGDTWSVAKIYDTPPNHTTVNMTGGTITDGGIQVHDAATFNFSGGSPGSINAFDESTTNITGGLMHGASAGNNATMNISGNASIGGASAGGSGTLNIYGGTIGQLYGYDYAVVNLYGGAITNCISVEPSGTINVFGYDLAKTNAGGTHGYGQITGFWLNALPFTINLADPGTYSVVNLNPEPATLLLLGTGAFLLRRSKRRMNKSE